MGAAEKTIQEEHKADRASAKIQLKERSVKKQKRQIDSNTLRAKDAMSNMEAQQDLWRKEQKSTAAQVRSVAAEKKAGQKAFEKLESTLRETHKQNVAQAQREIKQVRKKMAMVRNKLQRWKGKAASAQTQSDTIVRKSAHDVAATKQKEAALRKKVKIENKNLARATTAATAELNAVQDSMLKLASKTATLKFQIAASENRKKRLKQHAIKLKQEEEQFTQMTNKEISGATKAKALAHEKKGGGTR